MEDKVDTQTRKDPGASFATDSEKQVLCAWVTEERNRILRQELTKVEERAHAEPARKAKGREWDLARKAKGAIAHAGLARRRRHGGISRFFHQ